VEAKKRGKAAVAAAKGELELPEEKKSKGRWLKWFAVAAAIAGVAVFVGRKFLGAKDADWQAARPTTPYAPRQQATEAAGAGSAGAAVDEMDDSGEDPQGGMSAHMYNLEADGSAFPDQPAEGGDMNEASAETASVGDDTLAETTAVQEAPVETTTVEEALAEQASVGDEGALLGETAAVPDARPRYEGEGVYLGSEPPEGFTIKGNERSMKYHVPESAGYGRTVAEVWFNSEEAAQQAGFVRAQR
jgi:hypothetical protein